MSKKSCKMIGLFRLQVEDGGYIKVLNLEALDLLYFSDMKSRIPDNLLKTNTFENVENDRRKD